jgi:tetratricopeptide (TPR) repeat protein
MSLALDLELIPTAFTAPLQMDNTYCFAQLDPGDHINDTSIQQPSSGRDILTLDRPLLPVPSYPPSRKDWDSYRAIFTQLYQVEDKSLKVVKEVLEAQYGFKATYVHKVNVVEHSWTALQKLTVSRIRMYNKRIKDWKVMKNYKRKEKDAVCCALQKRTQAGKISHHVTIRDQPVKFQRILRHMKGFANGTGTQDSDGPSTSTDDNGVEVRTPNVLDDESSLPRLQANSPRRPNWNPEPGRPILSRDDQGIAEILCRESVGYFQKVLSRDADPPQRPKDAKLRDPIGIFNWISLADFHANRGCYSDARIVFNRASEQLKRALREQSTKLLPAMLRAVYHPDYKETRFNVRDLFNKHAADLCETILGVQHPTTVVMRMFRKVESKAQVFKAVFESLLGTVRTQFTFGEAHDLSICLVKRRWSTLQVLAQYQEAERIFERAVTICTSMHGTRHVLTLRLLDQLACLAFERRNYSRAKLLFERLLRDSRNEDGGVTEPLVREEALTGLAHLAKVDGDLPKAEALLREALDFCLKRWGPKDESTICVVSSLEQTLRECSKESEADRLVVSFRLEDDAFM